MWSKRRKSHVSEAKPSITKRILEILDSLGWLKRKIERRFSRRDLYMSQMMDLSTVAATSIDNRHYSLLSNNSLASTLASATQENQHRVCIYLLAICYPLSFLLRVAILCGYIIIYCR